ncbi:nucleotide-binding universal stress UspA family protein [Mucilaginibacter gracilis]|uniref:Nucleotide-binding universal stress UspA family protein n=1 Tax=Mucilaginibacter gracilis TaxID=423350 RepID=A0A495J5E6_9SPHI|nr:universal stress protein [Mucilaginibacter gracilis]RKR83584.1 nucleotide-binding universal stress UspA family protein [Mucilaginibacter gracilis]
MKTILVLTNLLYKAENAALYAVKLAEKTEANVILYQSIKIPVYQASGANADADYNFAELQSDSLAQLNNLAARLSRHHPVSNFKPHIEVLSDFGELAANVNDLIATRNIDLVVMGAKSDGNLAHMVFGETNAIITRVKCPVLFVPYTAFFEEMRTIVFSTDLKKAYPKAVAFLVDLAKVDESDIIITHIGSDEKFNHVQCLDLFQNIFEYPNVTFKQLPNGNVSEQLERFAVAVNADLTVMIHHEHTLYGMPLPDNSTKMLEKRALPLLVLPD